MLHRVLAEIEQQFTVPTGCMKTIAAAFHNAMVDGLAGRASSLKMLPSFIGRPTGQEQGKVVAVDFGGTNVRILLVALTGQGQFNIVARRSFPLKDKAKNYDYTSAAVEGKKLFDFIAGNIAEIVPNEDIIYPLGHTFSFPCRQFGVNQAQLISWTKEFKTAGVEGQDIGQLLQMALDRKGQSRVVSQAVINDTTGTLLAAAYRDMTTDIGTICGTGHNSCYLEPCHPLTSQPMVVNMESGNFDKIAQTKYDVLLDAASEKPGAQRLEKMVSGQYLGEIVRIIISDLRDCGYLTLGDERLSVPYSLPTEEISVMLADTTPNLAAVASVAASRWGMVGRDIAELAALQTIASFVALRSARLAAATWVGVLLKIDPELDRCHNIAVDGSLYEKMPGYAGHLSRAIKDMFGAKASQVTVRLSKDGSGIGAAIAAATVYNAKG